MIKIQLVDDEPNVLNALKRSLRNFGWEIHAYADVQEALDSLHEHDYAVIVSDYRMPHLDGITYLQFAKQRQPDALRLIISAFGDYDSMLQAINRAEIYRFLAKPWEEHELESALRSAVDLYLLKAENQQLLRKLREQQSELERQQLELRRLEREHPGITHVRRDADGAVLLDDAGD